jgi:IS1 family transposase
MPERSSITVNMNKLDTAQRAQVLRCLVDGNSIRGTVRITGIAKNTIVKLLADIGCACTEFQDRTLRNLTSKRIQVDEIWSFVGMKDKQVPEDKRGVLGYGDAWTWTAIDADTKLVPSWLVGHRDSVWGTFFMQDLASRLSNRVQLTSDGHKAYLVAVDTAFAGAVDYSMLVKIYGPEQGGVGRYSPAACTGCKKRRVRGRPDPKHVSTSYAERQNLTMRMNMRRFTRLTNAFSKKIDNLEHAVALHFMHYNFCRVHMSLNGQTPAMAAGKADHVWTLEEVVGLLEPKAMKASN